MILHCSQAPLESVCNVALKKTKQTWDCSSTAFAAAQVGLLKTRKQGIKVIKCKCLRTREH